MPRHFRSRPWLIVSAITVIAGLAYSSWPLGYWLNPIVNQGLASDLEAIGQPYNWVFIGLDILSGLLIFLVTAWLFRKLRKQLNIGLKLALLGFGAFGLLTAVDALLPLDCVNTLKLCSPVFADPFAVIHGIGSIGSIAGLTISIIGLWWALARDQRTHIGIRLMLHGTVVIWAAFGILTFTLLSLTQTSSLSQHVFIVVCSVWMAFLPVLLWHALAVQPAEVDT